MLKFKIRYSTQNGEMGVSVNKTRYVYFLDAGFIPKIRRIAKHSPGKALSFLKQVSQGYEKEGE